MYIYIYSPYELLIIQVVRVLVLYSQYVNSSGMCKAVEGRPPYCLVYGAVSHRRTIGTTSTDSCFNGFYVGASRTTHITTVSFFYMFVCIFIVAQ